MVRYWRPGRHRNQSRPNGCPSGLQAKTGSTSPARMCSGYNGPMVRLDMVLDTWKSIRRDTAQAVEDMPPGELDFRPTPDLMPFRELALHVLNASNGLVG